LSPSKRQGEDAIAMSDLIVWKAHAQRARLEGSLDTPVSPIWNHVAG